jgi:DNA-binding protein HU-beta
MDKSRRKIVMTKTELVSRIAEKAGLTKADSEKALNAFLSAVEETLINEGKLTLTGFGTFVVEERKERKGRNPRTGKEITIPACKVVKFRPGKLLKEAVK